jgi:hypothetical protein
MARRPFIRPLKGTGPAGPRSDDHRDDGPSGAVGEDVRRRLGARDARLRCRAAASRVFCPGLLRSRPRRRYCPPRELDVGGKTGAAWGEKSAERLAQRNGYRDRVWETRAGTIELAYPEAQERVVFPGLPGAAAAGREGADRGHPSRARRPRDATLEGSMSGDIDGEAYSQGISTRSVDDLVKAPSRASWPCLFQRSDQRPPGL